MRRALMSNILLYQVYWVGFGLLFALALLVLLILDSKSALLFIGHNRSIWLNHFFMQVTKLGEIGIFALTFVWYAWKDIKRALLIPTVGILSLMIALVLKLLFAHDRPVVFMQAEGIWDSGFAIPGSSFDLSATAFPSGHTYAAFALFTMLVLLHKPSFLRAFLCLFVAFLVALSRIYLFQHFLKDVIFGAFLGAMTALVLKTFWDMHIHPKIPFDGGVKHRLSKS